MMEKQYETVIGLEVHVELATSHKDFLRMLHKIRRCAQHPHLPGLHRECPEAFRFSTNRWWNMHWLVGLAANCGINQHCRFDRKNYFYPDNPQNYQISQLYLPICHDGWLDDRDTVRGPEKDPHSRDAHGGGCRKTDP